MVKRKQTTVKDWLPLAKPGTTATDAPTGEAFNPAWIDFKHGIRVGNLEPHERITRILKYFLEQRYATPFVTDRWGRGVYWQWICWLPRANREAKPESNKVNFGCAKLFIAADQKRQILQSGLQIERGHADGQEPFPGCALKDDWDWHRLVGACKAGSTLDGALQHLLRREGFTAEVGDWETNTILTATSFTSARQIRDAARKYRPDTWVGFQLYYPMPAREVRACTGYELVQAICAAFSAVVPAMNACMQVPLKVITDMPLSGDTLCKGLSPEPSS